MATRRTTANVEIPLSPAAPRATPPSTHTRSPHPPPQLMDSPAFANSPFLPTLLESLLLAIYPTTLLLGSLFSTLHPSARAATYLASTQAYAVNEAPSYFAKKSNVLNVYFVKIGWVWITLAFFLFALSHSSLGKPLRLGGRDGTVELPAWSKRRVQATLRYITITAVWVAVTQWCFGPPIIDRSFRWTGGACRAIYSDTATARAERADMGDLEKAFTHAACKTLGGQWAGGHDISGHVFLLILGSAMLWLELLPAVLQMDGLREARRIKTSGGLVRSAAVETEDSKGNMPIPKQLGVGVRAALGVAGLSWWMLLMTAAYFHTWFEKFTGLLVAFTAIYAVYFLPRAVPAWRRVVGMPGV